MVANYIYYNYYNFFVNISTHGNKIIFKVDNAIFCCKNFIKQFSLLLTLCCHFTCMLSLNI